MAAHVQQPAPDFKAQTYVGGEFKEIKLSDFRSKYVYLFFYPMDFTSVCNSEVVAFSDHIGEFEQRGVQVLGVSGDSQYTHRAWVNTPRSDGGPGPIAYPLIADLNKNIARDYGVLLDGPGFALRGSYLIDKNGIVRHMTVNDVPLGRSTEEALRMIDALQQLDQYGEMCPAN